MLRSKGNSFVCDVNGFSFVKTSKKYYQDCANQLSKIIMKKLERELSRSMTYPDADQSLQTNLIGDGQE